MFDYLYNGLSKQIRYDGVSKCVDFDCAAVEGFSSRAMYELVNAQLVGEVTSQPRSRYRRLKRHI